MVGAKPELGFCSDSSYFPVLQRGWQRQIGGQENAGTGGGEGDQKDQHNQGWQNGLADELHSGAAAGLYISLCFQRSIPFWEYLQWFLCKASQHNGRPNISDDLVTLNLFLLRHGETTYSQSGAHCGWIDPELTADGLVMAEQFAQAYRSTDWQGIYCSPMKATMGQC